MALDDKGNDNNNHTLTKSEYDELAYIQKINEEKSKVKVKRIQHPMWEEWQRIPKHITMGLNRQGSIIGRWQYIVSSERGAISVVSLPNYFYDGQTLWEVYCLEGNLFEDISRFDTFKEAIDACKEMLVRTD